MTQPIMHVAVQAARNAGNMMIQAAQRMDLVKVIEKKPNDFVTEVDQRIERETIAFIRKYYPSHSILAEESGEQKGDDYQWIIDPIDGTRNFIHQFPHFAISIAVAYRNRIEYGVIYDPLRQELFIAKRGGGAQLNDQRIRVSAVKQLKSSLLGTGYAFRYRHDPVPHKVLEAILPICGDMRRTGAATLDLAYVAAGRLDGFWEFGLKLWDMAAGLLLVKEAGGMICDPYGGEDYLHTGDLVAANPVIMRQILKTIKQNLE